MKHWKLVILAIIMASAMLVACSDSIPAQNTASSPSDAQAVESSRVSGEEFPWEDNDPNNPMNIATIDTVIEALQNLDDWVIIDVRTSEEYNGLSRLPNAYGSGRIKGSINVARELVFDSNGELLSKDELIALYEFIGDRKAIVYCHGGARSAFIWEIVNELGFDVLNYSGSWVDWSRSASAANGSPNEIVLSFTEAWIDNEGEIEAAG